MSSPADYKSGDKVVVTVGYPPKWERGQIATVVRRDIGHRYMLDFDNRRTLSLHDSYFEPAQEIDLPIKDKTVVFSSEYLDKAF